MKDIKTSEIKNFVEKHICEFHDARIKKLEQIRLKELLKKKNPYLFKAKNMLTAGEFVTSILEANLSSSEEEIFGEFLEHLAVFVAAKTLDAKKSSTRGIDIEYQIGTTRYLLAVKSGLNWGNSSQWSALKEDYKAAKKVLHQSRSMGDIKCILGVCYGKAKTIADKQGFITQICGQSFWHSISGKKDFYTEIIEPLGYKAKELNVAFKERKSEIINKFSGEFIEEFCDRSGKINWEKVVIYNSSNMTTETP